ncbi:MAG: HAMP domain-containing sensor histidine kinase [Patescibacteria group bacterium]
MKLKEVLKSLDINSQCRRYGLALWQCPQFLFLVMGIIIIAATIAAYFIGNRYIEDPLMVSLVVISMVFILFIIAFIITQSFERLAEASRMKSEFISIVSHQLRSPLTNLKWTLDFLTSCKTMGTDGKQSDYFDIIKENTSRMGELIDHLLIVSRIEQGRLPQNKEEVSFEELVKKVINDAGPFAKISNVEVEFVVGKNLPKFFVDPIQIKLVIDNLLNNAIRYTKGNGRVLVSLSREKNNFHLSVKDNGVGIPKEDRKYIFQKFFRAQNAPKYQTQGTGLGLYIAKSVAENSGGKIGFESEEGKGSTFWVTLPIA